MKTQYTITITKKEDVALMTRGDHSQISTKYLSKREYNKLSHGDRKDWKRIDNEQYQKTVWEYPPPVESTKTIETKVYEQTVDSIDITGVITAVNTHRGSLIPMMEKVIK